MGGAAAHAIKPGDDDPIELTAAAGLEHGLKLRPVVAAAAGDVDVFGGRVVASRLTEPRQLLLQGLFLFLAAGGHPCVQGRPHMPSLGYSGGKPTSYE